MIQKAAGLAPGKEQNRTKVRTAKKVRTSDSARMIGRGWGVSKEFGAGSKDPVDHGVGFFHPYLGHSGPTDGLESARPDVTRRVVVGSSVSMASGKFPRVQGRNTVPVGSGELFSLLNLRYLRLQSINFASCSAT
jgi:hypothetical protein